MSVFRIWDKHQKSKPILVKALVHQTNPASKIMGQVLDLVLRLQSDCDMNSGG